MDYEFDIMIPSGRWEAIGSEGHEWDRLLTTLGINGTPHHLEAIRIRVVNREIIAGDRYEWEPTQEAIDPEVASYFARRLEAMELDSALQTTTINGIDGYVLLLEPFSDLSQSSTVRKGGPCKSKRFPIEARSPRCNL